MHLRCELKITAMAVQFLTSITEQEFKEFLKEALKELLGDRLRLNEPTSELMNIEEAAKFLKLKVNTLYEKTCRKTIPHLKKGNKLYFQRSTLEKWIDEGRVKTQSDLKSEVRSYQFKRAS